MLLVSLTSMLTMHLPLVPLLELSALHVDAERHAVRVWVLFKQLNTTHA